MNSPLIRIAARGKREAVIAAAAVPCRSSECLGAGGEPELRDPRDGEDA